MNRQKERTLLTTPQDRILPDICFRDEINHTLDKKACTILNNRHQHVYMYEGNMTFPQKTFTLFQHNMGLIDIGLADPVISEIIEAGPDARPEDIAFVVQFLQGLLIHDHGEGIKEPMTALLKWMHPELVPHAKRMERFVAPALYKIALCTSLKGRPSQFLKATTKIQKTFEKQIGKVAFDIFTGDLYSKAVDNVIVSLEVLQQEALRTISPEQRVMVEAMTNAYTRQYESIEDPESSNHGTVQKFIKLIDKNCPSYPDHAKARCLDPNGTTPMHDQFTNKDTINDLLRSEKPFITFMQIKNDPAAIRFAPSALTISIDHICDYLTTARPVIFTDNQAPAEPDRLAARAIWLNEAYHPQMDLVKSHRQNGIHFLEDPVKTNKELTALLTAKKLTGQYLDRSMFDMNINYSAKFVTEADQVLKTIRPLQLAKTHAEYILP